MKRVVPVFLTLFLLLAGLVSHAQAADNCEALLKQRKHLKTARCFQARADKMAAPDQLSKIQRYLKGQYLRSAWSAYNEAAKRNNDLEKSGYYRAQALQLIDYYLKNKLCPKQYLCLLIQGERAKISKSIGFAQLTVVTDPKMSGFLEVKGYKYTAKHTTPPQWSKAVRPGRYTITLTYENQKPMVRKIIIRPKTPRALTMFAPKKVAVRTPPRPRVRVRIAPPRRTPPKQAKSNVVPLVLIGVGAAAVLAGGGLLTVAFLQDGERSTIASSLVNDSKNLTPEKRAELAGQDKTKNSLTRIDELGKSAAGLEMAGYGVGGAGLAIVLTGVVLAVLPSGKTSAQKTALPVLKNPKRKFVSVRSF